MMWQVNKTGDEDFDDVIFGLVCFVLVLRVLLGSSRLWGECAKACPGSRRQITESAFITPSGLYSHPEMSFGLRKAPSPLSTGH